MKRFAALLATALLATSCAAPAASTSDITAPPVASSGVLEFGETWRYADGLTVTVSEGRSGEIYTITQAVRNGTNKPFNIEDPFWTISYGPDNSQSFKAIPGADQHPEWYESFDGELTLGETQTHTFGYAFPAEHMDEVRVEFQPDPAHTPAVFASKP